MLNTSKIEDSFPPRYVDGGLYKSIPGARPEIQGQTVALALVPGRYFAHFLAG
jgi:hypothetical protein